MLNKKHLLNFRAVIFAALVVAGITYYLKKQDKDYDSLIARAAKLQRDHHEFIDFYGEREPAMPDKGENAKSLLGIDANQNGIRDDIDVWINRTALDRNEMLSMRQYASARQRWLKACAENNVSEVLVVKKKMDNGLTCLTALSDYTRKEIDYAKNLLETLILNTEARKGCEAFYTANPKRVPFSMGGDANYKCDFEIQYPQNVISGNEDWKKQSGD